MRILTIDTATPVETVAVVDGGAVLAERTTRAGRGHADELVAAVADVLDASSVSLNELDGVAVSIGPGRFTGLRVGLATAKGLAAAAGLRILPVPTLEALAAGIGDVGLVCPMLDARRGEVYAALFRSGPAPERLAPDCADDPSSLAARVGVLAQGELVTFVGTGATLYESEIDAALVGAASFPGTSFERPSPAAMAALAARAAGDAPVDAASLSPFYLRGV